MTTRAEQAAAVRYVAANYRDLHMVFVDLPVALSKEALLDAATTLEESARERPGTKTSLTPDFLRRLIAQDRELSAAASPPPWWHSHSTILRMHETKRDGGEIVASMWVPPGQSYMGKLVDPTTELPNARFIVHARTALLRRDEAIEHLLGEVERLEAELAEARSK